MVIGTNVTNRPHAILVLNPPGSDQGFLLPQLTTTERNGITPTSAEEGLVVFDITEKSFYYWKEGAWTKGEVVRSCHVDSSIIQRARFYKNCFKKLTRPDTIT